jgi:hypothetical protein
MTERKDLTPEQRIFLPQILPISIYLANIKLFSPDDAIEIVQKAYELSRISYRILTPKMARKLMDYCNLWDMWEIYTADEQKEIKNLANSSHD